MSDNWKEWPRLAITGLILVLFAYAVFAHWGTGLEETLKNIVLLAVGYWLGSSRGAATQAEITSKSLDAAHEAIKSIPNAPDSNAIEDGDQVKVSKA